MRLIFHLKIYNINLMKFININPEYRINNYAQGDSEGVTRAVIKNRVTPKELHEQ